MHIYALKLGNLNSDYYNLGSNYDYCITMTAVST